MVDVRCGHKEGTSVLLGQGPQQVPDRGSIDLRLCNIIYLHSDNTVHLR